MALVPNVWVAGGLYAETGTSAGWLEVPGAVPEEKMVGTEVLWAVVCSYYYAIIYVCL